MRAISNSAVRARPTLSGKASAPLVGRARQAASLRYGRVQLCATFSDALPLDVDRASSLVAQSCTLPYRRFAIGSALNSPGATLNACGHQERYPAPDQGCGVSKNSETLDKNMTRKTFMIMLLLAACSGFAGHAADANNTEPLPGTQLLTMPGDIASNLVAGVDRFLLRELDKSVERRGKYWKRDFSSAEAYNKSIEPNRKRLAHIIGVRDERVPFDGPQLLASTAQDAALYRGSNYAVYAVSWAAFGDVRGEGLLLTASTPISRQLDPKLMERYGFRQALTERSFLHIPGVPDVIAIPDADQTPEQIAGLVEGVAPESQFARRLAESGCRVLVPTLINRAMGQPKSAKMGNRGAGLSNREFLYRSAFELGRGLIGYEVQKVLAAVDWFAKDAKDDARIGVIGWGEGGLIALYAGALDPRIGATCVSGYFEDRRNIWQGPIDRNVFGLLEQFGDAELAGMIAPRALIVEAAKGPEVTLPGNGGGAPARLVTPKLDDVRREFDRAKALVKELKPAPRLELIVSGGGTGANGTTEALDKFLSSLSREAKLASEGKASQQLTNFSPKARADRQFHEIDRHSQALLTESPYTRAEFMKKLDTSSLEKYEKSAEPYRQIFYDDVIGRFDEKALPPNVRTRKAYDTPKWAGYEVVMDVFPDVIAYGVLLLPKDLKPGEKRPVVVCQHGLEGRPQDIITGDKPAYHDFAAKLAERGFITFSPQNLYIFTDRFRTLQRKANPLKKTLFSIITPQHQQIVDWLKTLPNVDAKRIAFYGLSYGGKTAMRVPGLVTDYCLSICSADFNEWVWKNASTRSPYSYVWTGEYEIFEFDLGSTFNYAEMAALIAPRPFMVERGHFDGVAPDETVGYEFGKVRFLYQAKLGIGDRCELEWFVGPHTINGKGTYDFLHKHLDWPRNR
jgi:dienelactone hydrolase